MMRELLSELESVRRSEAERAKAVASFEQELAQAVEAMNSERANWENERAAKADELALKEEQNVRLTALVRVQGQKVHIILWPVCFFFVGAVVALPLSKASFSLILTVIARGMGAPSRHRGRAIQRPSPRQGGGRRGGCGQPSSVRALQL